MTRVLCSASSWTRKDEYVTRPQVCLRLGYRRISFPTLKQFPDFVLMVAGSEDTYVVANWLRMALSLLLIHHSLLSRHTSVGSTFSVKIVGRVRCPFHFDTTPA